jgi:lipid-A-disaccharide synthase
MQRVFISAGETSGDMHAAGVVAALRHRFPELSISGIAGPAMQAAGCAALHEMSALNVMGISDVVRAWPRIRQVEKGVLAWAESERPDVAILVDFPGFHMRLGARLRRLGIPVLQYIAPKLWAWGSWRTRRLHAAQDGLACILPFEPAWFADKGIAARYVGNPSAAACPQGWSAAQLKADLDLGVQVPLVALLPGSRPGELAQHVPLLAAAWKRVAAQRPEAHAVVPVAPGADAGLLAPLLDAPRVHRLDRMQPGYALRADAAVAVSGTATLELALWQVPSILIYRGPPLVMALGRRLVHLPNVGLANILLGEETMPELIQKACTEEAVADWILRLLDPSGAAVAGQRRGFARLQSMLGDADPAAGVVEMAVSLASGTGTAGTSMS